MTGTTVVPVVLDMKELVVELIGEGLFRLLDVVLSGLLSKLPEPTLGIWVFPRDEAPELS